LVAGRKFVGFLGLVAELLLVVIGAGCRPIDTGDSASLANQDQALSVPAKAENQTDSLGTAAGDKANSDSKDQD